MVLACGHTMCSDCLERVENCPVCRAAVDAPVKNYLVMELCDDEDWMEELRFALVTRETIPPELKPFAGLIVKRKRGLDLRDEMSHLLQTEDVDTLLGWVAVLKLEEADELQLIEHICQEFKNMKFLEQYNCPWLVQHLSVV